MKLYAVRIFVNDWEAACDFYGNTLSLPLVFKEASIGWAEFDVGGAHLGIEQVADNASEEEKALVGRFVGLSLQVENIQATYEHLRAKGVEFIEPPTPQPWGGVLAQFKDCCGNTLTLLGGVPT